MLGMSALRGLKGVARGLCGMSALRMLGMSALRSVTDVYHPETKGLPRVVSLCGK